MKLERLTSTTRSISREAAERARAAGIEEARRVNASEGAEGDRERSLQQELAAAENKVAMNTANDDALDEAREVAEQLVRLGNGAGQLLKAVAPPGHSLTVDTEA